MFNHFHLLLETPLANLSEFMRQFNITYTSLLAYGGDNPKGRNNYWQALQSDLSSKLEIKKQIIGNSILGNEPFIQEIKEKYLMKREKEIPSVKKIHSYCTKDKVIEIACREIGKTWEQIKSTPDSHRQILMEMLYRYAGLNNREIGELMALDYSTVSVGRRRLRGKLFKDSELRDLVRRIEEGCQE